MKSEYLKKLTLTTVVFALLGARAYSQNSFPAEGFAGIGTAAPLGGLHIKSGSGWSGHNFGANLVIDGTRNNAIALLDSNSGNPFAIANNGTFTIASMPPVGDTSGTPPEHRFTILQNGNVGVNRIAPEYTFDVNGIVRLGRTYVNNGDLILDPDYGIYSAGNIFLQSVGTMYLNPFPGQGDVQVGGRGAAGNLGVTGEIRAGGLSYAAALELTGTTPYIDFRFGDAPDYNVRLVNSGNGILSLFGGSFEVEGTVKATTLELRSDRNSKSKFSHLDTREVLKGVTQLPINKWEYNTQENVQHIGPTAQDFKSTFGVGGSETSISVVDGIGVALAAIKELARENEEKDRKIKELTAELSRLANEVRSLGR